MLKLKPKTNLKSLFLTGAATTATLALPMMMETASALTFASPNPGNTTCSTSDVEFSVECDGIYQGNVSNAISQEDVNALFDSRYDWNLVAKVD